MALILRPKAIMILKKMLRTALVVLLASLLALPLMAEKKRPAPRPRGDETICREYRDEPFHQCCLRDPNHKLSFVERLKCEGRSRSASTRPLPSGSSSGSGSSSSETPSGEEGTCAPKVYSNSYTLVTTLEPAPPRLIYPGIGLSLSPTESYAIPMKSISPLTRDISDVYTFNSSRVWKCTPTNECSPQFPELASTFVEGGTLIGYRLSLFAPASMVMADDGTLYFSGDLGPQYYPLPIEPGLAKRAPDGTITPLLTNQVVLDMEISGGQLYFVRLDQSTNPHKLEIRKTALPINSMLSLDAIEVVPTVLGTTDFTLPNEGGLSRIVAKPNIAVNSSGDLFYIAPSEDVSGSNFVVRKRALTGEDMVVMGGGVVSLEAAGSQTDATSLEFPFGISDITVDRCGNLFVSDGSRIYRLPANSQQVTLLYVRPPGSVGTVEYPVPDMNDVVEALIVDSTDNLYVIVGSYMNWIAYSDSSPYSPSNPRRPGWSNIVYKLVKFTSN